jgi:small subunit ribosomal protein S6
MSLYENIFIGRQDLSQQQMEALGVSLGLFVTQNGGEVVRGEYCGFRWLAYPIKKNRKGHYYIIQMKGDGALVAELGRIMRINEDIIRHLVVKVDKFVDQDNLISQAKTFGEEFGIAKDVGYRGGSRNVAVESDGETKSAANEVRE